MPQFIDDESRGSGIDTKQFALNSFLRVELIKVTNTSVQIDTLLTNKRIQSSD